LSFGSHPLALLDEVGDLGARDRGQLDVEGWGVFSGRIVHLHVRGKGWHLKGRQPGG
jgi:hypothetical protein